MPTVSTYLKMTDQFTPRMQRVTNQINTTIVSMERMRRLVERPTQMNINTHNAQKQVAAIERVVKSAKVDVTFNARQAVRRAQMMRNLIQKQLSGIQARIRIELPASLNVMFANLQRLVMQFIAGTRRLRGVAAHQTAAQKQIADLQQKILQLQNQINQSTRQAKQASSGWLSNLKGIAATYLSFRGAGAVVRINDEYINTRARLDLVNDGLQTTAELQEKIFAAAERSRGSYTAMSSVIGKMGILAGEAFTSNDELIVFSELMQKSFRVGGASTMEQQAGMYQLTQAMAAGRLQGDEFRSIMENAPMLAAAIADFTGRSKGELKEMSAEGTITADIIKGAMFAAADDINAKFETMPRTFSDIWTQISNVALEEFGPAIEEISAMLNDPKMQQGIKGVGKALSSAAVMAMGMLNVIGQISNFVSTNWVIIEPIIWGIVAAFGVWLVMTRSQAIAQAMLNAYLVAYRVAMLAGIAVTQGLTVAWRALNTAQKANVFILIVSLVIALITWLVNLWNTNDQFVAGFMRAWNSVLNFFDQIPIFFTKIGHGIANALDTANVKSLEAMESLANGVIDTINWLSNTLNNAFGLNLKVIEHLDYAAAEAAAAEARKQGREDIVAEMEANAALKAAEREQKVLDMLENRAAKRAKEEAEEMAGKGGEFDFGQWQTSADIDKVGEVGKIRDTVDISSEDLKTMRELAEMKNIQNFVTLTPQLSFGDTHVRQDGRSIDEIVSNIAERMEQELVASARGVYDV